MEYKGYNAIVTYDDDVEILHGEVIDTRDVITFQGRSVDELHVSFTKAVDDYLEFCEEKGREPDKPFSGRIALRLDPETHREIVWAAKARQKSLNTWITDAIGSALYPDDLRYYCMMAHDRWSELVAPLPDEEPAKFPHGHWEIAFSLVDAISTTDLTQILDRLRAAGRVMYNGWPVFSVFERQEIAPQPRGDDMVAWLGPPGHVRAFSDPQHCDYWSASRDGKLYLKRGYIEDGAVPLSGDPGHVFDIGLAIRRVAEALLFAGRFYAQFEGAEQLTVRCRFMGLSGRTLYERRDDSLRYIPSRACQMDEIIVGTKVETSAIDNNLAGVLHPLLHQVFEQFGFYDLLMDRIQGEIGQMKDEEFRER